MRGPAVTLSIVSHRQCSLVNQLIRDIDRYCGSALSLILTENVPDTSALSVSKIFPTDVIRNMRPKGFGANHNSAFTRCRTPFFGVMNPDITLNSDPLPALLETLSNASTGVVGPLIRHPGGSIEDSARRFPTLLALLGKFLSRPTGPDYVSDADPVEVDWIAGMFMLFHRETYGALGGFDERYFLYYEDVDLCRRLWKRGLKVMYDTRAEVVHDARRASRRDPRLAAHHLASMVRYFLSIPG